MLANSSVLVSHSNPLWKSGKMYERHRRRYSFCSKGERALDVVLIKVGHSNALPENLLVLPTPRQPSPGARTPNASHRLWLETKQVQVKDAS